MFIYGHYKFSYRKILGYINCRIGHKKERRINQSNYPDLRPKPSYNIEEELGISSSSR